MGGSGGGGSSGTVNFPEYMKVVHGKWLDNNGNDVPTNSLVDAINTAYSANPFTGVNVFDPDLTLVDMFRVNELYGTMVDNLDHLQDYSTAYSHAQNLIAEDAAPPSDDSIVAGEIAAYAALLDDQLEDKTLPAFYAGMHSINAVQTSAFVVGEAILRAHNNLVIGQHGSEARMKFELQAREIQANHKIQRGNLIRLATAQMITQLLKKVDSKYQAAAHSAEVGRMKIVAKKEQVEGQMDFDEKEGLWQVELFGHAQNLLSGISGGATQTQKRTNKAVSALGGALSGAAAGAATGAAIGTAGAPGIGTAVGAIAGAALGYFAT